jgi:hypothetical protein
MRRFAIILLVSALFICTHCSLFFISPDEKKEREYAAAAVTLSDFSMKIEAHYQSHTMSVPNDFDTQKFFGLLKEIYPDQSRVSSIESNFRVFVRPLDGGYSVMLCDLEADRKIMEDLSCHLNSVEIRSWQGTAETTCVFESNWKPYCE